MPKRQLRGTITSNKMEKTVVVKVERIKKHPRYEKRFQVSKKYKAHVSEPGFQVGDKVIIQESRPLSKDKRWEVKSLVREGEPKAKPER